MAYMEDALLVGLGAEEEVWLRAALEETHTFRASYAVGTCGEALALLRGVRITFLFLGTEPVDMPPLDFLRQVNELGEVWCALMVPHGTNRMELAPLVLESSKHCRVAGFVLPPWDGGRLVKIKENFYQSRSTG